MPTNPTALHPIPNLTSTALDEVIAGADVPVVVDVWTQWCPPCRAMEPVLAALAAEHAATLRVVKVDGDEQPDVVTRYQVMGFPTLLVFHHGELVRRLVGAKGKHQLVQELADLLP